MWPWTCGSFSNDVVRLNRCRGIFHGIQMDLIGGVSHAGALRLWKFPLGGSTNGVFQARLRQVARTVEEIRFTGTPLLQIEAGADGRDMNTFHAKLNFAASAAHAPWGDVTNLAVDAACARLVNSGDQPLLKVEGSADSAGHALARGRQISLSTTFSRGANSNLNAEFRLDAARFDAATDSAGSNWFGAARLSWNGAAILASSNFIPLLAAGKLRAVEPQTPWVSAREMSLQCRAARARTCRRPGPDGGHGPGSLPGPWIGGWRCAT